MAMTTASTDAHTDVAPLTPQSHGAIDGERCRARRIPRGNAIPRQKPTGSRMPTAIRMRTGVSAPSKRCVMAGVAMPKTTSTASVISSRRLVARPAWSSATRPVDRLPAAARHQQREQDDRQAVGRMAEEDRQPLQL